MVRELGSRTISAYAAGMPEMAMFPLSTVLLPGMILPLQVFEPRYRTLMERCMDGDRRFGVTLIERGSEVGGSDVRSMVGTVAEITRAERRPDGRWGVVAVGTERIRVDRWLPDDPYPRAHVTPWPDQVEGSPARLGGHVAECLVTLGQALTLTARLGHPTEPVPALPDDPSVASYQLALLAPLATLDRHRLLSAPGPTKRLVLLDQMLIDLVQALRFMVDDDPNR